MIPDLPQQMRRSDKDPRRTVIVRFSAYAPRLKEQLAQYKIDRAHVRLLQEHADALVKLYFCDLITDAELRKVRKRLMKKIARHVDVAAREREARHA